MVPSSYLEKNALRGWSVVLDFDGTITRQDVADSILRRYGGASEREIRSSYHPGVITEDWVREKFLSVRCSRETLRCFVLETARPRAGALAFMRWCLDSGVHVEIVSGGLDLYLDLLLKTWELSRVPRFCARARITRRGVSVRYPFLAGSSLDSFKLGRVREHQRRGRKVAFAGDGSSDLPAARAADVAFARGYLLRYCRQEGLETRPLRSFGPLHGHLRGLCSPR